jgi:hypothetical protein
LANDAAWVAFAFVAGGVVVYLAISIGGARLRRESFIRQFVFPASVLQGLQKNYPALQEKDLHLVARALRQYFLAYARSRGRPVGMPSRAVDVLWHEFILDTAAYQDFCNKAFGKLFHHIPAGKEPATNSKGDALRVTWRFACLEENIDPRNATRLPLLFAIDAKLNIPDGHLYELDVVKKAPGTARAGTCGGFGCAGGDSGSHGCGGGCSGGCSGH